MLQIVAFKFFISKLIIFRFTNHFINRFQERSNVDLAVKYSVNSKTIAKHKSRTFTHDKSSRPDTIHYALSPLDKEIIRVARTLTWMELDDLTDTMKSTMPHANRSNIYRTLKSFGINQAPKEQKEKAKKFKEYKLSV